MFSLHLILTVMMSIIPTLVQTAGKCYNTCLIIITISYNITDITVHPQSVNTTLNSTVDFTCEANTLDITFLVDNTLALAADVINRGFTQQGVENLGNGKWRRVLLAKAFEDNNNTNISCRAYGSQGQKVFSDIAVFRIQGELIL